MTAERISSKRSGRAVRLLEGLAAALVVTGLFFLLTNGIPLAQLKLVDIPFSKKVYVRLTRVVLISIFSIFAVWAWRWPASFRRLAVIRGFEKISRAPMWGMLSLLFIAYSVMLTTVGFMRHWAVETGAFDLGIFAQVLWNTLQGNFLYSSIKEGICLLGDHVSPILILIAPLYRLWPDPKNLILIQAVVSAACLFPLGYLAREKTGKTGWALVFAVAYFFYLPSRMALHEDFHPEVLVEPFLLLAFLFLEKDRIFLFLLSVLIAVSGKENMFGISLMLGFYAFVWKRRRGLGVWIMASSIALFLFEILWVVPHFSKGLYLYRGSYSHLWADPLGVGAQSLFQPEALEYLLKIFTPFLFLPFFHLPTLTLTFPILLQNIISRNPTMRSLAFHYTVGLTPFLFIATIYGFCVLTRKNAWVARHQRVFAAVFLSIALLRSGPSEYFYFTEIRSHRSSHRDLVRIKLNSIPSEASVATHNNLIPQVINRKEVRQFSHLNIPTRVELARQMNADYVILEQEFWETDTQSLEESLRDLTSAGYRTEFKQDGFYVLKKRTG